jgi:outer membrane protein OmpA-like peptidoglycan-associated protein
MIRRLLWVSGTVLSVLLGAQSILMAGDAENSATEPGMPWPISQEEVDWHKILGAAAASASAAVELDVTVPGLPWPISNEPANWHLAISAPEVASEAEEASVTEPGLPWPVSAEPANWQTDVAAPAAPTEAAAEVVASVTEPGLPWPVSNEPANWSSMSPAVAASSAAQSCQDSLRAAARAGVVLFKTGSAAIAPESNATLEAIAKAAKDCAGVKITVEGHTDSTGSENRNKRLSERRAKAIVEFLVNAGVSKDVLSAVGFGQEKPVAANDSEENRAKNRRIEFTVN